MELHGLRSLTLDGKQRFWLLYDREHRLASRIGESMRSAVKRWTETYGKPPRSSAIAASLAQVIRGTAPQEYRDAPTFFRHSYPTRGMKELLEAVCKRVSGAGGEVASIVRLQTPYGGGKTHLPIALIHAMRGMPGVKTGAEFVDPALLPKGRVRLAALDGENSDPADGLTFEDDSRAFSLWGELAYRLAGREGYERVRQGDQNHVAPGAETIHELFGGEPTLILLLQQLTGARAPFEIPQAIETALTINRHIAIYGRLGNAGQACCFWVYQTLADEPQDFHPLLHTWMRVLKTFLVESLPVFFCK